MRGGRWPSVSAGRASAVTVFRSALPFMVVWLWAMVVLGQESQVPSLPLLLPPPPDAAERQPAEGTAVPPAMPSGSFAAPVEPAVGAAEQPASRFAREFLAKGAGSEGPLPRILPDVVAVPGLGGAFGECPRELLRVLLGGAAERNDALSAVALETEVLVLCRERQTLVNEVLKLEEAIAALIAPAQPPAEAPPQVGEDEPVVVIAELASGSSGKADLRIVAVDAVEKKAEPEPEPQVSYAWFSIIGSGDRLVAGVSDGDRVWFVREGDSLPGKVEVGLISARPPGVLMLGESEESMLPYGPRPEPER